MIFRFQVYYISVYTKLVGASCDVGRIVYDDPFLVFNGHALVQLTWSFNTRYHMDAYTTFFIGAMETLG